MMFIIDGHNLLHTIYKLEGDSGAISDVSLCRILGRYLKLTGEKGEMVFDGTGPPDKSGFDNISDLEVFFAVFKAMGQEAFFRQIHGRDEIGMAYFGGLLENPELNPQIGLNEKEEQLEQKNSSRAQPT